MRTLILGIGNTLLSDDGAGIRATRLIKKFLCSKNIDIAEANTVGLSIIDYIRGYDKVVIIDSIRGESIAVGSLHRFNIDQIDKSTFPTSHGINLPLAIEFGRKCGENIPQDIRIYAIGVKDTTTFKECCTPEIEEIMPCIVDCIISNEFSNISSLNQGNSHND